MFQRYFSDTRRNRKTANAAPTDSDMIKAWDKQIKTKKQQLQNYDDVSSTGGRVGVSKMANFQNPRVQSTFEIGNRNNSKNRGNPNKMQFHQPLEESVSPIRNNNNNQQVQPNNSDNQHPSSGRDLLYEKKLQKFLQKQHQRNDTPENNDSKVNSFLSTENDISENEISKDEIYQDRMIENNNNGHDMNSSRDYRDAYNGGHSYNSADEMVVGEIIPTQMDNNVVNIKTPKKTIHVNSNLEESLNESIDFRTPENSSRSINGGNSGRIVQQRRDDRNYHNMNGNIRTNEIQNNYNGNGNNKKKFPDAISVGESNFSFKGRNQRKVNKKEQYQKELEKQIKEKQRLEREMEYQNRNNNVNNNGFGPDFGYNNYNHRILTKEDYRHELQRQMKIKREKENKMFTNQNNSARMMNNPPNGNNNRHHKHIETPKGSNGTYGRFNYHQDFNNNNNNEGMDVGVYTHSSHGSDFLKVHLNNYNQSQKNGNYNRMEISPKNQNHQNNNNHQNQYYANNNTNTPVNNNINYGAGDMSKKMKKKQYGDILREQMREKEMERLRKKKEEKERERKEEEEIRKYNEMIRKREKMQNPGLRRKAVEGNSNVTTKGNISNNNNNNQNNNVKNINTGNINKYDQNEETNNARGGDTTRGGSGGRSPGGFNFSGQDVDEKTRKKEMYQRELKKQMEMKEERKRKEKERLRLLEEKEEKERIAYNERIRKEVEEEERKKKEKEMKIKKQNEVMMVMKKKKDIEEKEMEKEESIQKPPSVRSKALDKNDIFGPPSEKNKEEKNSNDAFAKFTEMKKNEVINNENKNENNHDNDESFQEDGSFYNSSPNRRNRVENNNNNMNPMYGNNGAYVNPVHIVPQVNVPQVNVPQVPLTYLENFKKEVLMLLAFGNNQNQQNGNQNNNNNNNGGKKNLKEQIEEIVERQLNVKHNISVRESLISEKNKDGKETGLDNLKKELLSEIESVRREKERLIKMQEENRKKKMELLHHNGNNNNNEEDNVEEDEKNNSYGRNIRNQNRESIREEIDLNDVTEEEDREKDLIQIGDENQKETNSGRSRRMLRMSLIERSLDKSYESLKDLPRKIKRNDYEESQYSSGSSTVNKFQTHLNSVVSNNYNRKKKKKKTLVERKKINNHNNRNSVSSQRKSRSQSGSARIGGGGRMKINRMDVVEKSIIGESKFLYFDNNNNNKKNNNKRRFSNGGTNKKRNSNNGESGRKKSKRLLKISGIKNSLVGQRREDDDDTGSILPIYSNSRSSSQRKGKIKGKNSSKGRKKKNLITKNKKLRNKWNNNSNGMDYSLNEPAPSDISMYSARTLVELSKKTKQRMKNLDLLSNVTSNSDNTTMINNRNNVSDGRRKLFENYMKKKNGTKNVFYNNSRSNNNNYYKKRNEFLEESVDDSIYEDDKMNLSLDQSFFDSVSQVGPVEDNNTIINENFRYDQNNNGFERAIMNSNDIDDDF